MNTVLHVFTDVYMGYSHAGLSEMMKQKTSRELLKRGELAVFVNKQWTACKILASDNTILYHREPSGGYLTIDDIRRIPTALGGKLITFGGSNEARALRDFEKKWGKQRTRLKAAGE